MTVERSQVGWRFGILWMLVTTVGWAIGVVLILVTTVVWVWNDVMSLVFAHSGEAAEPFIASVLGGIFAYVIIVAAPGSVLGLVQWLVLRRQISRAGWWILASAAGLAVATGAGIVVAESTFDPIGLVNCAVLGRWVAVVVLGGAVISILQWFVLRRQVSQASWWVLANTLGWASCMALSGASIIATPVGLGPLLMSLIGGGVVLGAVTGGALVRLLRQPLPEA